MLGLIIKSVDIQGFRGIRKLSKPLELSRITVLVGGSGSGKTAVLEALYLLSFPFGIVSPYNETVYRVLSRLYGSDSIVYKFASEARIRCSLAKSVKGFQIDFSRRIDVDFVEVVTKLIKQVERGYSA